MGASTASVHYLRDGTSEQYTQSTVFHDQPTFTICNVFAHHGFIIVYVASDRRKKEILFPFALTGSRRPVILLMDTLGQVWFRATAFGDCPSLSDHTQQSEDGEDFHNVSHATLSFREECQAREPVMRPATH